MTTKRDFERAARIAQQPEDGEPWTGEERGAIVEAFVEFFRDDNPRFDEARFRAACVPGNNVRARPRKAAQP